MIVAASMLRNAATVVSKIRRIAGGVQNVRNDFLEAGGGIRGTVAGIKSAARLAFPDTVACARAEIEQLRSTAAQEVGVIINQLKQELEDLRSRREPTDTVETQLAAAIQCQKDITTAAIEAICDIEICRAEAQAEEEFILCKGEVKSNNVCPHCAPDFALEPQDDSNGDYIEPYEPQAVHFLRPGIQENFHHPALRKAGCYFFTLCRMAEYTLGKPLGEENIVPLFNRCVEAGIVKPNAFIKNPVKVLNLLCGAAKFSSVVRHTNDPQVFSKFAAYVRRVKSGKHTHFLLSINGCTWDSLGSNAHNYRPAGLREIA